jgi:hypothetical protein
VLTDTDPAATQVVLIGEGDNAVNSVVALSARTPPRTIESRCMSPEVAQSGPAGPVWRLIVQRDGKHAHLFTCNGHDWSDRYPLITEAALRNRNSSFVIDGEAVLLGIDGISDFNGLHSRKHDDEV